MADGSNVETKSKPDVEKVTMTDGREVGFAGKKKLLKEYFLEQGENGESKVRIQLDFRNGETRSIVLPDSLLAQFAGHGALQKYGDETAGLEDIDDMVLAIDELDAHIQAGEWSTRKEGTGMGGTSILLKALVEASGKAVDDVRKFLSTKSQAEKIALRNTAKIKPIVERLEAEKASKGAKVDTEALLAELG